MVYATEVLHMPLAPCLGNLKPRTTMICDTLLSVFAPHCSMLVFASATEIALECLDKCVDLKSLKGHVIFDYQLLDRE